MYRTLRVPWQSIQLWNHKKVISTTTHQYQLTCTGYLAFFVRSPLKQDLKLTVWFLLRFQCILDFSDKADKLWIRRKSLINKCPSKCEAITADAIHTVSDCSSQCSEIDMIYTLIYIAVERTCSLFLTLMLWNYQLAIFYYCWFSS